MCLTNPIHHFLLEILELGIIDVSRQYQLNRAVVFQTGSCARYVSTLWARGQ